MRASFVSVSFDAVFADGEKEEEIEKGFIRSAFCSYKLQSSLWFANYEDTESYNLSTQ